MENARTVAPPGHIVLLRHGVPNIDGRCRTSPAGFGRWVADYNAAGIDSDQPPPPLAIDQARRCAFVVCSNLPRSLTSAEALGVRQVDICTATFREMEMPYAHLSTLSFPRLPVLLWSVFFRVLWLLGFSAHAESFTEARSRARECADHLATLAAKHGTVLFVGHGSLNWFIARALKSKGWSGPRHAPSKHWAFGIYRSTAKP